MRKIKQRQLLLVIRVCLNLMPCPFGLSNAPVVVQEHMSVVLQGCNDRNSILR